MKNRSLRMIALRSRSPSFTTFSGQCDPAPEIPGASDDVAATVDTAIMDGNPNYSTFTRPCSVSVGMRPAGERQMLWVADCGSTLSTQQLRQAVLVPPYGTPLNDDSVWSLYKRGFGERKAGIEGVRI